MITVHNINVADSDTFQLGGLPGAEFLDVKSLNDQHYLLATGLAQEVGALKDQPDEPQENDVYTFHLVRPGQTIAANWIYVGAFMNSSTASLTLVFLEDDTLIEIA